MSSILRHRSTSVAPGGTRRRFWAALTAVALLAGACGSGDGDDAAESTTTTAAAETETVTETTPREVNEEVAEEGGIEPEPTTTTTTEPEPTTTTAAPDLGGPIEFGPAEGQPLAVISVRYDDELNFRAGPGTDEDIVRRVAPLDDTVITAAGEAWAFERSVWWKVVIDGEEMWANQTFLGMLGATSSIFDEVEAELDTLEFASLQAMTEAITDARTVEEPAPDLEYVTEPLSFDSGDAFVVVDFVGFLDDAVSGERLRIEAEVIVGDDADEVGVPIGVRLTDVEATVICSRGVTEGLCL